MSVQRFLTGNQVIALSTALSASSAAYPVNYLKDQLRSKVWRSLVGWNVTTGENNLIDFNRGGVKVATIPSGNYATAAAVCTAVVAAFEAADATPVWACSYSPTTFKFTISSDLAFTLLNGTGVNVGPSFAPDMGYAASDTGSATSQVAGSASYKSREILEADFGSALAVTAGIVINHNLGASGTIKLQGHVTPMTWLVAPYDVSQTLAGDAMMRAAFFASQTKRYWRLLIDDVSTNTAGYSEVGVWYAGTYWEPGRSMQAGFIDTADQLSRAEESPYGALYFDSRPYRRRRAIEYRSLSRADRDTAIAMVNALGLGRAFFLALDPDNYPTTETMYGYLASPISLSESIDRYSVAFDFVEALG